MYGDNGRLDGRTVLFCMVTTDGRTLHKNSTDWIKNILIGSLKIKVVGLLCTWYVLGIVRCRIVLVPVSTLLKYQKILSWWARCFCIVNFDTWKIKFFFVRSNFENFYLPLQPLLLPLGLYRAMVSTVARYLRIFPTDEHVVSVFSNLIPGKIKFFFRAKFCHFARRFFLYCCRWGRAGKYCCSILNNW